MQQTKSYLWLVAVAGVLGGATALSACVVTTSTDVGGFGGEGDSAGAPSTGGGGAASAGAPAAGASSQAGASAGGASAGSGGAPDTSKAPMCDVGDVPGGTPIKACEPEVVDACTTCIKSKCCDEHEACFATSPGNVCAYGGPNGMGEFACYRACLQAVSKKSGGVIDPTDIVDCGAQCVTTVKNKGSINCDPSSVGIATSFLIGCVSDNKCDTACYGG